MPIKIIDGDLLDTKAHYICHQVNCQGKMGSGVAKQIREKFPKVYKQYKLKCDGSKRIMMERGIDKSPLLSQAQIVYVGNDNTNPQAICNLFSQDQYGYNGKQYTDYGAFEKCLLQLKRMVPAGETIAMPYKIGCGLGGGDWNTVLGIITKVLSDDYTVELWRKEG